MVSNSDRYKAMTAQELVKNLDKRYLPEGYYSVFVDRKYMNNNKYLYKVISDEKKQMIAYELTNLDDVKEI